MKQWLFLSLVACIPSFAQVHLDDMMSDDEKIKTGVAILTTAQKMELELWIEQNFVARSPGTTTQTQPAQKKDGNLYLSENINGGKQLRLSDGSTYEIAPDDVQLTGFWITPFPIKVLPSQDHEYPFLIINSNTGTAVKAKLANPASPPTPPPPAQPTIKAEPTSP